MKIKNYFFILSSSLLISFGSNSCKDKDGDINLFSVSDDKNLGLQVSQQIANDPVNYPVLPRTGNEKAYAYLENMRDEILNSGKINYKTDFLWELHIIDDDNTLNAFCTPGGYIYVYTGLIKYLDKKDNLMGVMGHEMAHADHRHSTDAMTRQYGLNLLFSIALGKSDSSTIANVAKNLVSLKYSRGNESEADMSSVDYLAATKYSCKGTAGFFEKLLADSMAGNTPQFLSTHPSPANRVSAINQKADDLKCDKTDYTPQSGEMTYAQFKALF